MIPPVAVSLPEHAVVFGDAQPRKIEVTVTSNSGKAAGDLRLELPSGWTAEPASSHFELAATEEQTNVFFNLTPPAGDSQGKIRAIAQVGDQTVSTGTEVIQYPHIITQTLLPPAEATLVRADIRILSKTVGYVMGAGDQVPQAIRQLGCEVTLLTEADLAHGDLARFDAIVTGVRAFNTRPDLRANYQRLFDYANNGGTLIVQYNVPEGGPGRGGPGRGGAAASSRAHLLKTGRLKGLHSHSMADSSRTSAPIRSASSGMTASPSNKLPSRSLIPSFACCTNPIRSPARISTDGSRNAGYISPTSGIPNT